MEPDEMKIIQIPEISAIYFGLLQSGYDFYSIERSSEHVHALMKLTGKKRNRKRLLFRYETADLRGVSLLATGLYPGSGHVLPE